MMPSPLEPAPVTRGRYELGDVLGRGGMATIHRAFDRLTQREVAYKVLRVAVESSRARMTTLFRREFDALARLEHPNIVRVYDFGVDERGPYYTMELVPGADLTQQPRLPVPEACRILRDVASALALVHARRLIHRDVSPANVRLTDRRDAKLIDFGALTPFGVPTEVVGTPTFIAPECLTGEPLDQGVDLYALGGLAYWILTGQLAVRALTLDELPAAWAMHIPPPSSVVPEITPELDDLVLSLLRGDRGARPTTAGEVVERLTNIAELAPEQDEATVALSYLRHPPLRARERVVAQFARSLAAVGRGSGGVLSIEGAPGAGRTAMLDQLGIHAQLSGATVLRLAGAVHRGPLQGAMHLVRTARAIHPDLAEQLQERHASFLQEVPRTASPADAVEHNARTASAVQETLLQLGVRAPTVLLVDDAHLLDAQSLAVLASMATSLSRHAVLLVLSRPSGQVDDDAQAVLLEVATRMTLAPLAEQDVVDLVHTMFGGVPNTLRVARWLFAESAGNPAHTLALLDWLLRRGAVRYARGTFTLPHDIAQAPGDETGLERLAERLSGLDASAVQIARVLALHGAALGLDQLSEVTQLPAAEVLDALHTLAGRSLVIASGGRYVLAGSRGLSVDLTEALEPSARRALHLSLARMLDGKQDASVLARMAAGLHRIHAGGEHELAGAQEIFAIARGHDYEGAFYNDAYAPLAAALATFEKHGYDDLDCAFLLGMLTARGFAGDLATQRRYIDRALRAFSTLTGMDMAARLRPYVGAGLALVLGLLWGIAAQKLRRARLPRLTFREQMQTLVGLASSCVAAEACAFNAREAERIAAWLEPLAPAPAGSALQIGRQNTLAIAEQVAQKLDSAVARYRAILTHLNKPVAGLDERLREQLRLGCLNCLATAYSQDEPAMALEAAEELAREPMFAPHGELIRMFYHGIRGDRVRAEAHRKRGETLALLGGASWSSVVLLNLRCYGIALRTSDLVELSRVTAELERLASLSPALAAQHRLAQADLLLLRKRAPEALPIYAEVLASEVGRSLPTYYLAANLHARALRESGQPQEAKALCERLLMEPNPCSEFPLAGNRPFLEHQRALAEAALGRLDRAAEQLESLIVRFGDANDPLFLGELHGDRARVAILAKNEPMFEKNFLRMQDLFRATDNPWLVQQCDALLSRAVRAGMMPAIPARELQAIAASPSELDGATVLDAITEQDDALASLKRA